MPLKFYVYVRNHYYKRNNTEENRTTTCSMSHHPYSLIVGCYYPINPKTSENIMIIYDEVYCMCHMSHVDYVLINMISRA